MNIELFEATEKNNDVIVIFHKKNTEINSSTFKQLNEEMKGLLENLNYESFKHQQLIEIPTFSQLNFKNILIAVFDEKKEKSLQSYREFFGKVAKKVKQYESIVLDLESLNVVTIDQEDIFHLVGEAFSLATYNLVNYKSKQEETENNIYIIGDSKSSELFKKGSLYGDSTNYARTLVNTPPNMLTATVLAEQAKELAEIYGFESTILGKKELEEMGAGALLAVNQGSVNPPAMIILKYQGKQSWENPIALVGKGVTYDTGGYSLKPRDSMVGMKSDMGGAASVLGAMKLIGELKPKQNVLAVIPSTDNMVSGEAMRPDDVITSLSKKTIEVLNTDAEGRLVLADGITYAKQLGAKALIDVATLTGGVITALGMHTTGVMTNDADFYKEFEKITKVTGERVWQLPIFESDKKLVRNSKMADLNNSPSRAGHAVMGGAFIGEFAEETPWLHLDIAGTSMSSSEYELGPSGSTGVMVRTLAHYICSLREE